MKNKTATGAKLTSQGQLLTASDVVWEQLYRAPATLQLENQGVKGVVIPSSKFVTNSDIVSSRAFSILLDRLGGASTGGTPSGKHGDGLVSVRVTPQGTDLSTSTATTVKVSSDLAFVVTVENSGDFQEVSVPVTLTIDAGGTPIKKQHRRSPSSPQGSGRASRSRASTSRRPRSATRRRSRSRWLPVAGEVNTSNNSATYTVFFTLS